PTAELSPALQAHNTTGLPLPRTAITLLLSLVLAVVLAAGGARPAQAQSAGPAIRMAGDPMPLGANTGVLFNSHRYTRAQIDAQLAALASTGATTVRSDALWETAEPNPPLLGLVHQYNWARDDLIAGSL